MLPREEAELGAQMVRHVERDGHGVVGQALDGGHPQRMEDRVSVPGSDAVRLWPSGGGCRLDHQMALNESKGSAHERQVQRDLHVVEPNRLTSRVSVEPQRGQRAASVNRTGWPAPTVPGG